MSDLRKIFQSEKAYTYGEFAHEGEFYTMTFGPWDDSPARHESRFKGFRVYGKTWKELEANFRHAYEMWGKYYPKKREQYIKLHQASRTIKAW